MANATAQTVWITGASSGIGEALARRYAAAGRRLILSSRREDELNRVAATCAGASVFVLPLDLSQPETMAGKVEEALKLAGAIDVMIHNGGVSQRSRAPDTAYAVDELLMKTNYLGPLALTKALLPHMIARRSGQFVVVTSTLGKISIPGRSGYCATKFALHGFFDALRHEVRNDGITITLAVPGFVRTNVSLNALDGAGKASGNPDSETLGGITAEQCANDIFHGATQGKREVFSGGAKERFAIIANQYSPALFNWIVRRYRR